MLFLICTEETVKPGRDSALLPWVTRLPFDALLGAMGHSRVVNSTCVGTGRKPVG